MPGQADLFATAEFENNVCVWSLRTRERLAALSTVLDFGGRRLCLVPGSPWLLLAAAYNRHGVCAYGPSGSLCWQRHDLKKIQHLFAYQGADGNWLISVGVEDGSATVVRAVDGRTVASLRGVREFFGDDQTSLQVGKRKVTLVSPNSTRTIKLESFAVLDAAFSKTAVLFSEAGGNVRCMTLSGEQTWTWAPGPGVHALRVAWAPSELSWLAVVWGYERGDPPPRLVRLDVSGKVCGQHEIGQQTEQEFLGDGDFLVSPDGSVRACSSGDAVWTFA